MKNLVSLIAALSLIASLFFLAISAPGRQDEVGTAGVMEEVPEEIEGSESYDNWENFPSFPVAGNINAGILLEDTPILATFGT